MTLKCTMIFGDFAEKLRETNLQGAKLCLTDFPYQASQCGWDHNFNVSDAEKSLVSALRTPFILTTFANSKLLYQLRQRWKLTYRYELIWSKPRASNFYSAKHMPMVSHEYIGIWGDGRCYNPQMRVGFKANYRISGTSHCEFFNKKPEPRGTIIRTGTSRMPISVLEFPKDKAHRRRGKNVNCAKAHSSQKPVGLIIWLIRTYSNSGDHVFDPTSGSGTTAVAALSCGRNVTCIERDEGYFDSSVERVRKHVRDNWIRADVEVRR